MSRLTEDQWQAIRTVWEYDPDEPSLTVAAQRAAAKFNFTAPAKGSVSKRIASDGKKGNAWERRASLAGINKSAHRKADAMVDANGNDKPKPEKETIKGNEGNAVSTKKAQAAREDSEDLRAEVIARHRKEWQQVVGLRQEALKDREKDPDTSFNRAKLAKITAEMTKIQQDGERKAWGMDDLGDFDVSKLSDEQLEKIVRGN